MEVWLQNRQEVLVKMSLSTVIVTIHLRCFDQWHLHFLETEHPCCTQVTLPRAIRYVNCVDPLNLVSNLRGYKCEALNEGSILGICVYTYIHTYWSHLEMSISAHSHDRELVCPYYMRTSVEGKSWE